MSFKLNNLILSLIIACYYISDNSSPVLCVTLDEARHLDPPIVINTWNFTHANLRAWEELSAGHSSLDAVEAGCSKCEEERCDGTVGWGGSPSESGETTLDAMIMDGETYDVGAVAGLRRVKDAISVARQVMERTEHTLLVGELATEFALSLGFKQQSLSSNESRSIYRDWLSNKCQPNYWKNVKPDPKASCGPYKPTSKLSINDLENYGRLDKQTKFIYGHDTIGMISMDSKGHIASGTSTNGLRFKIPGRVGDSPIPGAGSYAARDAGGAAATGDGDIIMRFLLSYRAVENLRRGMDAQRAATEVMKFQIERTGRPYPQTAVVVLGKNGDFGAACSGLEQFPFVVSDMTRQSWTNVVKCFT